MDISGTVAVVTGGSGVIGEAIISHLTELGATAVGWDVFVAAGDDSTIECDVADSSSVDRALSTTITRCGIPSILVNVAAVSGGFRPLATDASGDDWASVLTDPATWQRVLATNVIGVANTMRAFAREFRTTHQVGSIVNISSISAGPVAEPGLVAYSASKAAVNQLTRCAAAELGPLGIRVNALGPGLMSTPMRGPTRSFEGVTDPGDARPAGFAPTLDRFVPIERRLGRGDDIAGAVAALITMDWVTGQVVYADGGLTLRSPVTT